jgi:hypothetical protein
VKLTVIGTNLPGRTFCQPDGSTLENVCVGIQVGREATDLVAGDADSARWETEIRTVTADNGDVDFRGAAAHGWPRWPKMCPSRPPGDLVDAGSIAHEAIVVPTLEESKEWW